jgi:hypothetical protein
MVLSCMAGVPRVKDAGHSNSCSTFTKREHTDISRPSACPLAFDGPRRRKRAGRHRGSAATALSVQGHGRSTLTKLKRGSGSSWMTKIKPGGKSDSQQRSAIKSVRNVYGDLGTSFANSARAACSLPGALFFPLNCHQSRMKEVQCFKHLLLGFKPRIGPVPERRVYQRDAADIKAPRKRMRDC